MGHFVDTNKARVFLSLGLRESGFESQGRRTEKKIKIKLTFSGFFKINFVYRNFYYTLDVGAYKKIAVFIY